MWPVIPQGPTLLIIAAMFVVTMISTRWLQPEWWNTRSIRLGVFVAFTGMFVGLAVWFIGRGAHSLRLVHLGAGIAYVGILVLGPAIALLPLGALMDRGLVALAKRRGRKAASGSSQEDDAGVTRRSLLRATSATLPVLGAVTGTSGFTTAKSAPRLPVVTMTYDGLHPDLHGLRILQLSDVHLGASIALEDLERGLAVAVAKQKPDLIVLTGDLADDPALIGPAMDLVARVNARHGAFASLGNHEYLHGIGVTRPAYEKSAVPLLVSSGTTLRIGNARLFIGGADDPMHMGGDIAWMLGPSIAAAAKKAPHDADFRLLLCHRPEGFGPAVDNGFDLVLSGHTHGGQLGLFGRSLLEMIRPNVAWWGRYTKARPRTPGAMRSKLASTAAPLHDLGFRPLVSVPARLPHGDAARRPRARLVDLGRCRQGYDSRVADCLTPVMDIGRPASQSFEKERLRRVVDGGARLATSWACLSIRASSACLRPSGQSRSSPASC